VPEEMKIKWQRALGEYLEKRLCLKGLVVLMDIRHPLKDLDQQMIEWAVESDIRFWFCSPKPISWPAARESADRIWFVKRFRL
jgi:GTP-binding protein EngB required for normal cell division